MNAYQRLVKYLYEAQVASDAGKGIHVMPLHDRHEYDAACDGYNAKDSYIYKAIDICKNENVPALFSVKHDGGQCHIVYFQLKGGSRHRQISFHAFGGKLFHLHGVPMHWEQCSHHRGQVRESIMKEYSEQFPDAPIIWAPDELQ